MIRLAILLAAVLVAGQPSELVMLRGSSTYHQRGCQHITAYGSSELVTVTRTALPTGAHPCPICKPDNVPPPPAEHDLGVIISTARPLRKEPNTAAAIVAQIKADEVVSVRRGADGWALVQFAENEKGWIEGSSLLFPEVEMTAADLVVRRALARVKGWPPAIVRAVALGKTQIGFSRDQARSALGDPLSIVSEETAAGVAEVWMYRAKTLTFQGDKLASIREVKVP